MARAVEERKPGGRNACKLITLAALPRHNTARPPILPTCSSPLVPNATEEADPLGVRSTILLALPRHNSARDPPARPPVVVWTPYPTCCPPETPQADERINPRG